MNTGLSSIQKSKPDSGLEFQNPASPSHYLSSDLNFNLNSRSSAPASASRDRGTLTPKTSCGGFALVATLLMVMAITGAAIAFFQSMRIERLVSRNYSDIARAQMAAEGAAAAASAILRLSTTNDHFIIVANTNRQLFVGNGSNATVGNFSYQPLFSSSTNITNLAPNIVISITTSPSITAPTATNKFINTMLGGLINTSPPVSWVNMTNASGATNARFAFWVEDLAGMLDLSVVGSTGTNALRPTGTNPAEIALWSLFNPSTTNDTNNSIVQALINARAALITPATALLVTNNTALMADLATRLIHDTNEVELIPYGFGYARAGQPKTNLNNNLTAAGLSTIATAIIINLPAWTNSASRSGGMNGTNYVYALAANIIDYADADSTATATTIGGVNIVGFDNYPMLTHVFDQFLYSQSAKTITITTYLQFWNPSSTNTAPLLGGNFSYSLNDTVYYRTNSTGTIVYTNRPLATNALPNSNFTFGAGVSSNGFSTNGGYITSIANTISLSAFPNFPTPAPPSVQLNTTNGSDYDSAATNSFTLTGLGVTNHPPIVLNRGTGPNTLNDGVPSWIGSVLGSRMSSGEGQFGTNRLCADPRMLNYIGVGTTKKIAHASYANVYWGGYPAELTAAYLSGHSGNWPDGTNATSVTPNGAKNAISIPPTLGVFTIPDPATCKLSTNGSYTNITELGNVFDPIQWAPPITANMSNYANVDIPAGATWTANSLYGGGSTLRIGRPEHSRFTNDGFRASQLLDIFGVNTDLGATTVTNRVVGRINLNTATTNTLRALAAGVVLTSDPNLLSSSGTGINFTVPVLAVNRFIDGVTNFRSQHPFFAPSQLSQITYTNLLSWPTNAVFGNGTNTVMGVTSWTDAAREEWFSKIYSLTTVRSRNFLVYVVGQAMTTNTNSAARPIATLRQVYQVYAQPMRNSTGLTTNVVITNISTWTL